MPQPSVFWWQKYGTLAQMAQATVALLGFVAILFQINEIRTSNRAASARQAFLGYTDLAFKNPKFSAPDYDAIKAGGHDEQKRKKTHERANEGRHARMVSQRWPYWRGRL